MDYPYSDFNDTLTATITHLPTQKHVPGLQKRYCKKKTR